MPYRHHNTCSVQACILSWAPRANKSTMGGGGVPEMSPPMPLITSPARTAEALLVRPLVSSISYTPPSAQSTVRSEGWISKSCRLIMAIHQPILKNDVLDINLTALQFQQFRLVKCGRKASNWHGKYRRAKDDIYRINICWNVCKKIHSTNLIYRKKKHFI